MPDSQVSEVSVAGSNNKELKGVVSGVRRSNKGVIGSGEGGYGE